MHFKKTLLCLFLLPTLANAAFQTPNGKWFEEKFTINGTPVWIEVIGVIKKAHAGELSQIDQIKNFIITWSKWNEVDSQFMLDLAKCESGFKIDARGDYVNGVPKAYGLYQWWQTSWNKYNFIFKTDLERTDYKDQVRMSVQVVKKYGSGDWWNCSNFIRTGTWDKTKW